MRERKREIIQDLSHSESKARDINMCLRANKKRERSQNVSQSESIREGDIRKIYISIDHYTRTTNRSCYTDKVREIEQERESRCVSE